jgi:LPXTG-motif cell wall-anchored protein
MNNKTMLIGLGVLAVAGIGYYMWKKKNETTSNAQGDWVYASDSGTGGCPRGYTKITSGPNAGWCKKDGGGAISNPMGGGKGKGGFAMTRG